MSKLDVIKQVLETVGALLPRTDLPTKAYHGTRNFRGNEFEVRRFKDAGAIDRALGPHFGKDPLLSSTFAERRFKGMTPEAYNKHTTAEAYENIGEKPQILPVRIPSETEFLQAHQPIYPHVSKDAPLWQRVRTDERAVENMAAEEAYQRDPDLLANYLVRGRAMPQPEAKAVSRALLAGETLPIEGTPRNLQGLIENYMPAAYNAERITDLARTSWMAKGHKGIKYINTAPDEAGAPGVKDFTSYIVFDPKNIRSQFAKFDPRQMSSADLLASLTGLAGTGVAAGAVRQQGQQ